MFLLCTSDRVKQWEHTVCTYGAFLHVFTSVTQSTNAFHVYMYVQKLPSVSHLSCVLELHTFTSLMSLFSASFLYFLSHPISRIMTYFSLPCPLTSSSFPPVKQSLSILLPDLIMSVVSGVGGISGVTWQAAALRSRSHG